MERDAVPHREPAAEKRALEINEFTNPQPSRQGPEPRWALRESIHICNPPCCPAEWVACRLPRPSVQLHICRIEPKSQSQGESLEATSLPRDVFGVRDCRCTASRRNEQHIPGQRALNVPAGKPWSQIRRMPVRWESEELVEVKKSVPAGGPAGRLSRRSGWPPGPLKKTLSALPLEKYARDRGKVKIGGNDSGGCRQPDPQRRSPGSKLQQRDRAGSRPLLRSAARPWQEVRTNSSKSYYEAVFRRQTQECRHPGRAAARGLRNKSDERRASEELHIKGGAGGQQGRGTREGRRAL